MEDHQTGSEWYTEPDRIDELKRFGRKLTGDLGTEYLVAGIDEGDLPEQLEESPGFCNLMKNQIWISPQSVAEMMVGAAKEEQYDATLGVLAHEVGHMLFSKLYDAPTVKPLHHQMAGILEDGRIERLMRASHPTTREKLRASGVMGLMANLKHLRGLRSEAGLTEDSPLLSDPDPKNAIRRVLLRQLADSAARPEILAQVELHPDTEELGEQVDAIAQLALVAEDTDQVLRFARRIGDLLEEAARV